MQKCVYTVADNLPQNTNDAALSTLYLVKNVFLQCLLLPELPFSHIQHEFEDFQLLLPALDSCVKYVHNHKVVNMVNEANMVRNVLFCF